MDQQILVVYALKCDQSHLNGIQPGSRFATRNTGKAISLQVPNHMLRTQAVHTSLRLTNFQSVHAPSRML